MRSSDQDEATENNFLLLEDKKFNAAPTQARQKVLKLNETEEEAARGSGLEVYLIDVYFIRLNI